MNRTFFSWSLLCAMTVTASANQVPNGTFQNTWAPPNSDARLSEWSWGGTPGAQGRFLVQKEANGNYVKISYASPQKPNIFSSMDTQVKLQSNVTYELALTAKGSGNYFFIILGEKWKRFRVNTSEEWKAQRWTFHLNANELKANGTCQLKLLFERQGEYAIKSVSITPVDESVADIDHQNRKIYRIEEFHGNLQELRNFPQNIKKFYLPLSRAQTSTGMAQQFDAQRTVDVPEKDNFFAQTAFLYDRTGLILLADISDDIRRSVAGENMWTGDCIQLRFDCSAQRTENASPTDIEIGYNIDSNNNISTFCWTGPAQFSGNSLPESLVQSSMYSHGKGFFIVSRIDWSLLGVKKGEIPDKFGFNIAITDSDRPGQRVVYFLTPGIHDYKGSSEYVYGFVNKGKPENWFYLAPDTNNHLTGQLCAINRTGQQLFSVEFIDSANHKTIRSLGKIDAKKDDLIRFDYDAPLNELASGQFFAAFKLNGETIREVQAEKFDPYRKALEQIADFQSRLKQISIEREKLYLSNKPSAYIDIPFFILNDKAKQYADYLNNCKTDNEKKYYVEKMQMIYDDTSEAMVFLEKKVADLKSGKSLPTSFYYLSSDVTMDDGWPTATVKDENGKEMRRPVVFGGFGAFKSCRDNIENLTRMGANIIQQEIGPRSLFPREGTHMEFEPDYTQLDRFLDDFLERAWKNNVAVDLLIAPHYVPAWLVKKYPDMEATAKYCFEVEVHHPKMLEMLHKYLKYLIPRLKNHPYHQAIRSICLTNEPSYVNCSPSNPFSLELFSRYLSRTYGDIEQFNQKAKRNYKSFADFIQNGRKDSAFRYEFYRFSRVEFAGFHKMLADEVKKYWPGMAVHSKAMAFRSFDEFDSGVDPEMFAEFSDYNGNDGGSTWNMGQLAAETSFINRNDLQLSCRRLSMANTENHVISDREKRAIPYKHIYQEMFEQYATGTSTIITWRYAPAWYESEKNGPHSTVVGSIYHRPGNLVAHGIAYLDALRLAPILKNMYQYEPEVGMIYSMSSILQGKTGRMSKDVSDFFFSAGYKLRYVTEKQLADKKWANLKVIYAAGVPNLSEAAIQGLREFVRAGGTLYIGPDSIKADQYGNPVKIDFGQRFSQFDNRTAWQQIQKLGKLPVSLKSRNQGVFFRVTPEAHDNAWVNIVNYSVGDQTIELEADGKLFDQIECSPVEKRFVLKPLEVKLLRFTPFGR